MRLKTCRPPLRPSLRLGWLGCIAVAMPLSAQETEAPQTTSEIVQNQKTYFGITGDLDNCEPPGPDGELLVCGKRAAPPPRIEPTERLPRPDSKSAGLGAPPIPIRPGVKIGGCFLQKCPKELYFIDMKAIPEAPEGSEADKMSKGEIRAR